MTDSSSTTISEVVSNPASVANPSTAKHLQQHYSRNSSKRTKPINADDSFENEFRLANGTSQYFNRGDARTITNGNYSVESSNQPKTVVQRPSFPPFRIQFAVDDAPSELSIIKNINKHCRTSISYGRFSSSTSKKTFLVYANSGAQYDHLMNENVWPESICEFEYTLTLPSRIPQSYSIIVLGVPVQWNLVNFEIDIKKQHPSIVKIERLFVRNGIPIPKVRIDFSSNDDIQRIIKNKKILVDDEHTSFKVQHYIPPIKVLRCFNCQQYEDHIASNCPFKNNPVCFRCGQNHPFDPNCSNNICCANCKQNHMAGNPNCPAKIEARKKQTDKSLKLKSTISKPTHTSPPQQSTWFDSAHPSAASKLFYPHTTNANTSRINQQPNVAASELNLISNKLDALLNKLDTLVVEQTNTNKKIDILFKESECCKGNIVSLQRFILNKLCPFVSTISNFCQNTINQKNKEKLEKVFSNFQNELQQFESNCASRPENQLELLNSPSNESSS